MENDNNRTGPMSGYEGYDWDDVEGVPPADTLFRLLADGRRRRVLWFLLERPESSVEELADVLAGWQASEGELVGPDDRRKLLLSLHHHHLPALVDGELVRYDADSGSVRLSSLPSPVEVLVKFSYQYERSVGATE